MVPALPQRQLPRRHTAARQVVATGVQAKLAGDVPLDRRLARTLPADLLAPPLPRAVVRLPNTPRGPRGEVEGGGRAVVPADEERDARDVQGARRPQVPRQGQGRHGSPQRHSGSRWLGRRHRVLNRRRRYAIAPVVRGFKVTRTDRQR